jgi:hypothetical protein
MIAALLSLGSSVAPSLAQPPAPARAPVAAPPSLGTGTCLRDLRREAQGERASPRRLGELPPGDLQLAVVREIDGCQEPVIVRQDFGAARQPGR